MNRHQKRRLGKARHHTATQGAAKKAALTAAQNKKGDEVKEMLNLGYITDGRGGYKKQAKRNVKAPRKGAA